jgi:hypothetical protein
MKGRWVPWWRPKLGPIRRTFALLQFCMQAVGFIPSPGPSIQAIAMIMVEIGHD